MNLKEITWRTGEKSRLAKAADISATQLSDILAGRKGISKTRAKLLEGCSKDVRGEERVIPAAVWIGL